MVNANFDKTYIYSGLLISLKLISFATVLLLNNNAINLYTDSPWGTNFPYGTFDQQLNTTSLQGFRIFRGTPSDQGIYIADEIPDGVGFIIPYNYNPEYNYLEVARKAGLISG